MEIFQQVYIVNMKKYLAIALAVLMTLSLLTACGSDSSNDSAGQNAGATKNDIVYVDAKGDAVYRVIRPQESDGSLAAQKVYINL